jgi:hypothetical protein
MVAKPYPIQVFGFLKLRPAQAGVGDELAPYRHDSKEQLNNGK